MPSLDNVKDLLSARNFDVLCIGETWLTPDVSDKFLIFPGYSLLRCDRTKTKRNVLCRGGGVCIIYRDSLTVEKVSIRSAASDLDCLWVQVVSRRPIIIGVVYRPPSAAITPSLQDLSHQLTQVLAKDKPTFLLGDTNFDLLNAHKPGVSAYCQLMKDYSLSQLIKSPTHPSLIPTLQDHL